MEGTAGLNCDIGFISYHVDHRKLVVREVLEDRIVVIVPPGHPLGSKGVIEPLDLDGESIVTHERGSAPQKILQELIDTFHLNVNTPLELSSNESIKRAVAGGLGISIVPQMVADEEVKAGKLVAIPLSDTSIRRKFFLVHHKDKYFFRIAAKTGGYGLSVGAMSTPRALPGLKKHPGMPGSRPGTLGAAAECSCKPLLDGALLQIYPRMVQRQNGQGIRNRSVPHEPHQLFIGIRNHLEDFVRVEVLRGGR